MTSTRKCSDERPCINCFSDDGECLGRCETKQVSIASRLKSHYFENDLESSMAQEAIEEIEELTTERDALAQENKRLVEALEEALPMVPTGSLPAERIDYLSSNGHQTAAMVRRLRQMIAAVKEKS